MLKHNISRAAAERHIHVLVVDDDDFESRLFGRLLLRQAHGAFHIRQASDGTAGLAAMRAQKFDCVLLDFRLPDMTGLEFLAKAKADGELPCAVVLITGQGNEAIAVEAMKCGAQDYLIKGQIDDDRLWHAIERAINQVELRQQLARSLDELAVVNTALKQEIASRETAEAERQRIQTHMQELQVDLLHVSRLRSMGEMAAAMSHELNQPLTAITNYLKAALRLMAAAQLNPGRIGQALQQALQQTVRSGEIIRRLRSFATRGVISREPENVSPLIEEARLIALIGVKESDVDVRLSLAAHLPLVSVDRVQVQQVLLNLMRNAIEAMETSDRRQLTIEAVLCDTMVMISVIDTGTGISPAIEAQLFQPFISSKREGMGIGLSICRTIVEAHGGRLWPEPNPVGGTVFSFTLPVVGSDRTQVFPLSDSFEVPESLAAYGTATPCRTFETAGSQV